MNQEIGTVEVQRDRCPFCHDAVLPEQSKTACEACMAWHHKDCWADHGGCSACGEGASTSTKPSPKGAVEPEAEVSVTARALHSRGAAEPPEKGSALALSGLLVSLLTALIGCELLSSSYSATGSSGGIMGFGSSILSTPKGFDPPGVAMTLLLTVPLLILGAGLSAGGLRRGKSALAKAGLGVSALYAILLIGCSIAAFG